MDANGQRVSIENLRVSLKILHPPGGASSNIFGSETDDDRQPKQTTKNHMQSTIFAPADVSAPSPSNRRRPIHDSQNRLFGEPEALSVQQPEVKNDDSKTTEKKALKTRKGFNPITGESYDDISSDGDQKVNGDAIPQSSPATPSTQTRTRQPPGGVASKLW